MKVTKMVKIIKPGKIPDPNEYIGRCTYCQCLFKCSQQELYWGDQREPASDCRCPTCGKYVKMALDKDYGDK